MSSINNMKQDASAKFSFERQAKRILVLILILVPVANFLTNLISWLRFGVDLPYLDDIRPYYVDMAGSFELSYLFSASNDTLYPVGMFLDSLAYRMLDGNSVAYQALSMMVVLGGLLWTQYRLLKRFTDSSIALATCFGLTLLMLQPDSYWGLQNMAYHQAVPILCILIAIEVIVSSARFAIPAVFLLGAISGLTYISGAFSYLALAMTLLVISFIAPWLRLRWFAVTALIPGILTSLAQGWVIVFLQHGTHRADTPMSYPWQADFWIFMLGKIARAALLPPIYIKQAFVVALLLSVCMVYYFFRSLRKLKKLKEVGPELVYVLLSVSVFVYLALISAGRANMHPVETQSVLDIFAFAFGRFHFFWVTLLFPWLAAVFLKDLKATAAIKAFAFVMACSLVALSLGSTIFRHGDAYKSSMFVRLDNISCLRHGVLTGKDFRCGNLHPGINMKEIFYRAKLGGASFVRLVGDQVIPVGSPGALFSLSRDPYQIYNFGPGIKNITTGLDPMIYIRPSNAEAMHGCKNLQVVADIDVANPDLMQLFFVPKNGDVSQANSQVRGLISGTNHVIFDVVSRVGFEDFFRLDPVTGAQKISINNVEARCLWGQ
ncbi:hypothetical protein [Pseudomonas sp. O11]|uniref:hypothetical protein n=1 Tax=Pseudomonas sp. O11 TaxID=3159446 RepID=UPI00387AB42D